MNKKISHPSITKPTRKKNNRLRKLASHHAHSFFSSLGRLWRAPVASLMTIAVIGIALAMPTGLYVLLQNIQAIGSGWNDGAQISLFLKMTTSPDQVQALLNQIKDNPEIASAKYISPKQGLSEFEQQSGFGNVLAQLHKNPLPPVVVVHPSVSAQAPANVNALLQKLQQFPQVDNAQLDMHWIKRLYAFIDLAKHGVLALGVLFAIAVLLIIGNTLRLAIQNHRAEIEIIKLVGATRAFIRLPYLYAGMLYGFLGALCAYILVELILFWLAGPVQRLAGLYQTNFGLLGLNFRAFALLMLLGIVLGLLGSRLAIGRQLKAIEP